ncbi:MAG: pyridoxal-phosphate dependent enzyme [Halieaceae bacterium]|nr:pyridoxal-phosphate dependent enzyme [Halieaceae bacterium]MCP5148426.1 pyridoxal-phosphate dependent enzyme [Pseudomonadales bacterium]MCP5167542.1 pyridoxal-phosphate dependent enzyme [Pseudomonadales bacterium]MCP5186191.1 pyridoxal-phosphate dependent enzyme [Pseudomonadales bacterium]
MSPQLLTSLDPRPVAGVSMANVSLLRLDLTGGLAPGNKHFKLRHSLLAAQCQGIRRLVSFGGPWSNHLHALAAVGREQGLETVGLVRGADAGAESAMLADARAWGMRIVRVERSEFRRRNEPAYLREVATRFGPCLVVPEGGSGSAGVRGCQDIAGLLRQLAPQARRIVLPVGTGTTLAGVVAGLDRSCEVIGVAALKGAVDLEQRVVTALAGCPGGDPRARARWRILHDAHCGGFARVNESLRDFILEFEQLQGVLLEPVYTGKMLLAIHRRLQSGEWPADQPLLAIHTGGLQGRRGYSWLGA